LAETEIIFKVWARELKLSLKEILGPFSRTKGAGPPLGYILVQAKSGQVKLTVTDFRNRFSSQCFTSSQQIDVSFLVRVELLKAVSREANPNTEITFSFNQKQNSLNVKCNGVKTELPTLEIEKWPFPLTEPEPMSVKNMGKEPEVMALVEKTPVLNIALEVGKPERELNLAEVISLLRKKGADSGLNKEQMQLLDKNLMEVTKLIKGGPPAEQLSLL
jgi:hypothetical protein